MPNKVLISLAKKAGISLKDAEKSWELAKKEAKSMGQENNFAYVMDIFKSIVGLEESSIIETTKKLNNKFLKSSYSDFNKFQEDLLNGKLEETIMSVGFFGKTPSEEPIAISKVGNSDKSKLKPKATDHIGEHKRGKVGELEVEKNAKLSGFDIIAKINKDKDPRSVKNTIKVLKNLDSAEANPEIITETITSGSIGETPENVLDVVIHPPSIMNKSELKKHIDKIKKDKEDKDKELEDSIEGI